MLILLLLLCQEDTAFTPERLNAQLFVDGKRMDLVDVRIKGVQPYTLEFHGDEGTSLLSLFQIARITRLEGGRAFKVLFLSGEEQVGRIRGISFTADTEAEAGKRQAWHLQNISRIHFVQGRQLRSCTQGHYEAYTPYPFCPVCGNELSLGPYDEARKNQLGVAPLHGLRQDSRDPSDGAIRR